MSSSEPSFFPAGEPRPAPEPLPPAAEEPLEVLPADLDETPALPPKPPHPNFWWGLLWAIGFLIFLTGTQIAFFIVVLVGRIIATRGAPLEWADPKTGKMSPEVASLFAPALLGAEVLAVAAAWLVVRLVVGADWKRRLALGRPGIAQVVLALFAMPGLLVVPGLIHELASRALPSFKGLEQNAQLFSHWPVWFAVVVVGVCPGVAEELFCRGFLGRGQVGHYGTVVGVLLTSFLFGLLHVDPPYIVAAGVLGLWLHYVYLTSRSLPLSMLLHFLNNSAAVIWYSQPRPGGQPGGLEAEAASPSTWAAVLLLAAVAWALYEGRTRLVAAEPGVAPWRPAYPGVELPPPGSATRVVRPWPHWPCWLAVLAAAAVFAAALTVESV
jgi:CAAX protease family protein